jgi:hypothetical protein
VPNGMKDAPGFSVMNEILNSKMREYVVFFLYHFFLQLWKLQFRTVWKCRATFYHVFWYLVNSFTVFVEITFHDGIRIYALKYSSGHGGRVESDNSCKADQKRSLSRILRGVPLAKILSYGGFSNSSISCASRESRGIFNKIWMSSAFS